MRKKNPFGKTAKLDNPYAVYKSPIGSFEFRVLKPYQTPDKERENIYARWFVAAKSDMTFGSWEYGDTYIHEILEFTTLTEATDDWNEHYGENP